MNFNFHRTSATWEFRRNVGVGGVRTIRIRLNYQLYLHIEGLDYDRISKFINYFPSAVCLYNFIYVEVMRIVYLEQVPATEKCFKDPHLRSNR